jgi:hypothetical protein
MVLIAGEIKDRATTVQHIHGINKFGLLATLTVPAFQPMYIHIYK